MEDKDKRTVNCIISYSNSVGEQFLIKLSAAAYFDWSLFKCECYFLQRNGVSHTVGHMYTLNFWNTWASSLCIRDCCPLLWLFKNNPVLKKRLVILLTTLFYNLRTTRRCSGENFKRVNFYRKRQHSFEVKYWSSSCCRKKIFGRGKTFCETAF